MKRATITEAKNGLSALIDQVKAGESVLITDRGVPVARLEPATLAASSNADDEGRLARLERAGLVRPGTGDFRELLARPLAQTTDGSSVVALLLEDREAGW